MYVGVKYTGLTIERCPQEHKLVTRNTMTCRPVTAYHQHHAPPTLHTAFRDGPMSYAFQGRLNKSTFSAYSRDFSKIR